MAETKNRELNRQRSAMLIGIALAFPVALALWFGVARLLPPFAGIDTALTRLGFASGCICVAILLCLLTGIEAVAHERLASPAINPLAGYEAKRLRVNLRYLQNTLEQTVLFVPGVLGLAWYCTDMRIVAAVTVVWIATRAGFWIGYHYGSLYRAVGAPGMMQSILVLLYVSGRFGYELAGIAGAARPVMLFLAVEAVLFRLTR